MGRLGGAEGEGGGEGEEDEAPLFFIDAVGSAGSTGKAGSSRILDQDSNSDVEDSDEGGEEGKAERQMLASIERLVASAAPAGSTDGGQDVEESAEVLSDSSVEDSSSTSNLAEDSGDDDSGRDLKAEGQQRQRKARVPERTKAAARSKKAGNYKVDDSEKKRRRL